MNWKCKYRIDYRGVSPVIAIILLLAITVILASVSYLMFTSLIPSQQTSKIIGIQVLKSGDGKNWTVNIISCPGGLSIDSVYIITRNKSGAVVVPRTPLSQFSGFIDIDPAGEINGGDYFLLSASTHPIFSVVELLTEQNVLTHRVLE